MRYIFKNCSDGSSGKCAGLQVQTVEMLLADPRCEMPGRELRPVHSHTAHISAALFQGGSNRVSLAVQCREAPKADTDPTAMGWRVLMEPAPSPRQLLPQHHGNHHSFPALMRIA